jgi:aspartyl-tRNA(Asn)/glutamyl-tRNA(Gln) amidotransferase subunit A
MILRCTGSDTAGLIRRAALRDVALPPLADFSACGWVILLAEVFAVHNTVHNTWMRRDPGLYGGSVRDRLALGALLTAAGYMQAQKKRRELIARTEAVVQDLDLLLTAAQPGEAPRLDALPRWGFLEKPKPSPFNVSGWPGLTLCAGCGEGGLPVAMQLAAKPFREDLLFRARHAYERARPWRDRRPMLVEG